MNSINFINSINHINFPHYELAKQNHLETLSVAAIANQFFLKDRGHTSQHTLWGGTAVQKKPEQATTIEA